MNSNHSTLDAHPIFNPQAFYIPTPMIDQLHATLTQWLWCGATGGYIVGRSRAGKSRAIRKATEQLTTRSGQPIPVFYMDFHERDRPTVASVFRNLKRALDLTLRAREVADDMSDDILHCLMEAALFNPQHYVVLVVDEVQRATLQQLLAFSELYDLLVRLNTNLFVLFVANAVESDSLFRQLAKNDNEHLRGRFFINGHYYYGLRNHQEIQACLRQYDNVRYPDAQGATVTECFLPAHYTDGWRLHMLSKSLWRVYHEQFQKPLQLESWGMQYFTAAIKTLLVDYLPQYGIENAADVEVMIQKSIDASGLAPSTVMFS